jgi:hypothetical protein
VYRAKEAATAHVMTMLAAPASERNAWLAAHENLPSILRNADMVTAVRVLVESPDEVRATWAQHVAPHVRRRARLAMTPNVPHNVWLRHASGSWRPGQVVVTWAQHDQLRSVGFGDRVTKSNVINTDDEGNEHFESRWYFEPPMIEATSRVSMTVDAYDTLRAVMGQIPDAVIVEHYTRDEDEAALLKLWETEEHRFGGGGAEQTVHWHVIERRGS